MKLFRRTKRVYLGKYEPPEPRQAPPVETVVDDGMLIADALVRMTLRNHIIVGSLRDHVDLDREALAALAAAEFETLADREHESAERIRFRREGVRYDLPLQDDVELDDDERREVERRERLHRAMSAAFAERATTDPVISDIIERARSEAWLDVADVITRRLEQYMLVVDGSYERERAERVAAFLALDLSALAVERGVDLH